MSKQRVITVFGATGAQGGGLARAILADPKREFTARAVTRKPDSPKARALAAAGAEIVAADLDDVSSLERAMQGAHGVFGVTNFWEHFSAPKEYEQATNLAEAAKRAEVALPGRIPLRSTLRPDHGHCRFVLLVCHRCHPWCGAAPLCAGPRPAICSSFRRPVSVTGDSFAANKISSL